MTMIRRINLFGGPGAGKSTASHFLMWKLKSCGVNAELSREWIKRLAYRGEQPDQVFLNPIAQASQLSEELEALATKCIVVTDSPILLQGVYATTPVERGRAIFIARELEKRWPSLNIFLERGDKPYNEAGRWQTKEQAVEKDREIRAIIRDLPEVDCGLHIVPHDDWDASGPSCRAHSSRSSGRLEAVSLG